jgi:hypothetical protein
MIEPPMPLSDALRAASAGLKAILSRHPAAPAEHKEMASGHRGLLRAPLKGTRGARRTSGLRSSSSSMTDS